MSLARQVGIIQFTPSKKSYDDFIAAMNSLLANSGFQAVKLDGNNKSAPDSYPIAKAVLGVAYEGSTPVLPIPDMQGKTVIGSGTNTDGNGNSKTFTSGTIVSDGEYKHKLTSDEMSHFHVIGGAKDDSRSAFFRQGQVTPSRDLTGMNDYDSSEIEYSDFVFKETAKMSDACALCGGGVYTPEERKYVTTLNDNDPDVLTQREGHNNIQPSMGCHAWMIIDDPS